MLVFRTVGIQKKGNKKSYEYYYSNSVTVKNVYEYEVSFSYYGCVFEEFSSLIKKIYKNPDFNKFLDKHKSAADLGHSNDYWKTIDLFLKFDSGKMIVNDDVDLVIIMVLMHDIGYDSKLNLDLARCVPKYI